MMKFFHERDAAMAGARLERFQHRVEDHPHVAGANFVQAQMSQPLAPVLKIPALRDDGGGLLPQPSSPAR